MSRDFRGGARAALGALEGLLGSGSAGMLRRVRHQFPRAI